MAAATTGVSALEIRHASVPGRLHAVDLCLEAGQLVALIGPNGSGKSTLLQVAAGLLAAERSDVRWAGRRLQDIAFAERGRMAAWVPQEIWASVFATGHPTLSRIVGPLLGPLIAVASFVCSVGNVPLAAVLWNGGASFGGVVSFIFADLIVLPILDIYRRYYGLKAAAVLALLFYAAMALAGYVVELAFGAAGLIPQERAARVSDIGFSWNYTTWLNMVFLVLAAVLIWRCWKTGGFEMLGMMEGTPQHAHAEASGGAAGGHSHAAHGHGNARRP